MNVRGMDLYSENEWEEDEEILLLYYVYTRRSNANWIVKEAYGYLLSDRVDYCMVNIIPFYHNLVM